MKQRKRYLVISPDGFPIERDTIYTSKRKAISAFKKWKKRYLTQGYYSSNEGKIALEDLEYNCTLKEI